MTNQSTSKSLLIDCGGHVGESIMHFKQSPIYNECTWDIHSFEPHEELYSKMLCKDDENVTVHQKAVWTYDGEIDFYTTDGRSDYFGIENVPWGSSTLMKEKTSGNVNTANKQTVPCIDLSAFIKQNAPQYERIILKMDVEGAEYEILNHLFATNTIPHISALMIEYHYKKIKVSLFQHLKLKWKLKQTGIMTIEEGRNHTSGNWFNALKLADLAPAQKAAA